MARTILISASDAAYYDLLAELLRSVEKGALRDGMDVGVLDLGLEDGQREDLKARRVRLCVPALDYDAGSFRTPPHLGIVHLTGPLKKRRGDADRPEWRPLGALAAFSGRGETSGRIARAGLRR